MALNPVVNDQEGGHFVQGGGSSSGSGTPGPAGTVEVGTVTTGAAGTSAVVSNRGTSSAAILDFTIPKGDKGNDGSQGVKGDPGSTPVKGVDYFDGAQGVKGDKGDPGTTDYNALTNKPSSFPPSTHTHAPADVTGTAVITTDSRLSDARTPTAHTHVKANITDLGTIGTLAALNSVPVAQGNYAASATPATTGTMTVSMGNATVFTITPTGSCTFNASGGVAGQSVTFIITTSGTTAFTLTWGTNFKVSATLSTGTTTAKVFAVNFTCKDGTLWVECGRTAAM